MKKKNKQEFIDLGEFIIKYTRYWKCFLISIVSTVLLGILYIKLVDPTYYMVANVKLKTEEEGAKIASSLVRSFGLGGLAGSDNIDDEAIIMGSQSHMRSMVYNLGLYTGYNLKNFPFDKSLYNTSPVVLEADRSIVDTLSTFIRLKVSVKDDRSVDVKADHDGDEIGTYAGTLPGIIETDFGNFTLKYSDAEFSRKSYNIEITLFGLNYAAEMFRKEVGVGSIDNKSNIIQLRITDTDRQRGKDILNKLVELYNQESKVERSEEAKSTADFIQERITLLAAELGTLEDELENFKKQNKLINPDAESRAFISRYQDLQEKNTEIGIQQDITNMLNGYVSDPKNRYELIPTNTGVPSGTLEAIKAYNSALLERARLLQNTKESNPVIKNMDEQIGMLRKNVQSSIESVQKDIAIRKKDWSGLAGEMQSRMSEMPKQERQYIEMERQRQVKSELYVFLLTKMEETQLTLASTTPKAQIVDEAYNTWKPVAPKKKIVFGVALLLGFILPVLVIYLIDVFKVKLVSKEDLENATDIPVLGEIPLDRGAVHVAVAEGVSTSTAELFRLLRTNLQFILKKDEKVILVTSSISGEGKSFFTVNLAISFSLIKDKKVVLVGLDIRNPKLSEYLSVKQKGGLTLFLASDDMKPDEIIIHKPELHPNVYFVPAGPIPPNPAELLLGDRLDEFFACLRANFDYIIVDSAPVGMVSDTFSLDRVCDATLYLFRANYTNKSNLKLAESIVEEQKLKKLSLVMNGTTTKAAYGYGYGNKQS